MRSLPCSPLYSVKMRYQFGFQQSLRVNMYKPLIIITVPLFWITGVSLSKVVYQSPSTLLVEPNASVSVPLSCSHKIPSYNTILWYQRPVGDTALKLIAYVYITSQTVEPSYKGYFDVKGDGRNEAFLHLLKLRQAEDSGEYFCAASWTGGYDPAFFGAGTKLTVLEPDIPVTPPKVKVLPPSTKECEDRNKKKKKTLVCVATDFYPDHVTVFWQLNGGANITDGVGTDNTALRDGNRRYSITSRLRVPAKKWNKASNRFTCTVRFFNGNDDIYVADHINGEEGQGGDGEMTTEDYVMSTKTAKLAYSIFIAKSTFYGLVVMALIWRLQRSSDKQM